LTCEGKGGGKGKDKGKGGKGKKGKAIGQTRADAPFLPRYAEFEVHLGSIVT